MRSVLVAFLVTSAALLAGCSDDGGHEDHYECPDGTELNLDDYPEHHNSTFNPMSKCPKASGSSSSSAPNVLPTLSLTVTDDAGNETVVGTLMGNLTFSAEGSADSDGSITGIAVSVTDSNTTRTASLFDPAAKTFKTATFKFDRPGIVNVTVALVDDRAGFAVNQSKVYINHPQQLNSQTIQMPGGGGPAGAACTEGDGGPIVGASYFKQFSFALFEGATFVEATVTANGPEIPQTGMFVPSAAEITICSAGPDYKPLSETGSPTVRTPPGTVLPAPVGTESYRVGATVPIGESPNTAVSVFVVVHYEPETGSA